ncbi:MAG TPA: thioredoxin family protein [Pirellulales bacterium]|nr:thioredoxin family protein [Pirellulales bacterium]
MADDGWLHEFDEAATAAKHDGRDVLIVFSGTDWCGPCKRLWNQTLSRPEFVRAASRHFVLLDIDNLAYEAMPAGRKKRYDALQEQYGIHAFPTVVMATAEGLPYAATGLLEKINSPDDYWQHLVPLYERGQKFKAALEAAGGPRRLDTAENIVAALSELRPDFVERFYSDKLNQLRKLAPADATGYLAFIDTRAALLRLESKLYKGFCASCEKWSDGQPIEARWVEALSPADVDAVIQRHKPRGASLREALVVRLFLEIDAGGWSAALATLDAIAHIDEPLSRFEKANFVQFSVRSRDELRQDIAAARKLAANPMAQLRALYGIVKDDLECVTPTSCCNHNFTLALHKLVAGAAYGEMLLDTTADLKGEARAAAIGKGLEGVELFGNGSIGRIVCELMPELVGKEAAMRYLPPRYADWLRD